MAVSGFASLALEIVWFRILVQFLPATSYAFTMMLATVLAGIAHRQRPGVARADASAATGARCSACTMGATSIAVLTSLAVLARHLRRRLARPPGLAQGSAVAILPPAILHGLRVPDCAGTVDAAARPVRRDRAQVGTVYAANVVGGIAGAVLGGFVLLPWLGSRRALIACAALYLAAGRRAAGGHAPPLAAVAVVVLFVLAARAVPDPFDATLARRHGAR